MATRLGAAPGDDLTVAYRRLNAAYQQTLRYAEDVRRLYQQVQRAIYQSLLGLANALEAKDACTRGHSERVGAWSRGVAAALGLPPGDVDMIGQAGLLHDIGKIGIPEAVLRKPGALDAEEWAVMRNHPLIGAQIVAPFDFFAGGALMIRHHHERWDGSGYPDGLTGDEIPLGARIIAVADVYDALTSTRPYRVALSHATAIEHLTAEAGRTLDEDAVTVFVGLIQTLATAKPMWVLDQPYIPRADRLSAGTPLMLLTVLAAGAAAAVVAIELGALPARALRIVGVTAGHGALLASALAWAGVSAPSQALTVALLGLASTAAGLAPFGAVAYLLPALCVIRLAARGQLTSLSLGTPVSPRGVFAGILVGAGLSSHLLISASRTLGMQVRVDHVPEVLAAIAYDVGANVLAAECFFRGALFNRAQRRWSFVTAATVATAAYVLRYVVDPLLPKSAGLVVGAVFYLALLGAANCWLLWWSESLVPGLVSALLFFAAYRTLGSE